MGLDISFRRISCLLVVGLILLTVSALANAGAALSFPYTEVTEVAKSPVVWDPTRGAGVQTITKTCSAANSCSVKPVTQWIKRGVSGIGRFARAAANPWAIAAMIGAGWIWDEAKGLWFKSQSGVCYIVNNSPFTCIPRSEVLQYLAANNSPSKPDWYAKPERSTIVDDGPNQIRATLNYFGINSYGQEVFTQQRVWTISAHTQENVIKLAEENDVWDAFTSYAGQSDSWKIATADGQAINPWKDLFPDAAPAANSDEMPDISPSDARLLDLLKQGLLQTTDPLAPNYVTAENLARLEALQSQLDSALNQKAEDTLNAMKQPITQQQYDESNARDRAAFVNNLPSADFLPDPQESLNREIDFIQKIDDTPPASPDLNLLWGFTTGSCNGFTLPVSVAGHSYSMVVNKHCEWYPIFNAAVNWFLYLLTAFQVFHIFHRMVTRTI